jgi:DNA modification methylase
MTLIVGDCREVMAGMAENSVDAICTDPPYGLEFMGKEWDNLGTGRKGNPFDPHDQKFSAGGFAEGNGYANRQTPSYERKKMPKCAACGKWKYNATASSQCQCESPQWVTDTSTYPRKMQDWHETWAREAFRVLKPGGHLLAFGGTRTFHRMTVAIEDAGFEIRDCLSWNYSTGFPKSSRVNRDPRFCQCGESARSGACNIPEQQQGDHTGTAVASVDGGPQPSGAHHSTHTPSGSQDDCLPDSYSGDGHVRLEAMAGQASFRLQGCAPTRSHSDEREDGPASGSSHSPSPARYNGHPSSQDSQLLEMFASDEPSDTQASRSESANSSILTDTAIQADHTQRKSSATSASSAPSAHNYNTGFPCCSLCGKPIADGWGTALKPAWEPVIVARKPLTGTVAANVLAHGTGALNIDACRIGTDDRLSFGSREIGTNGIYSPIAKDRQTPGEQHALGRWPANVALDEAAAELLDEMSGERRLGGSPRSDNNRNQSNGHGYDYGSPMFKSGQHYSDSGGPSRFFLTVPLDDPDADLTRMKYTSKASRRERNAGLEGMPVVPTHRYGAGIGEGNDPKAPSNDTNHHPTVKPIALMRWLVRLVTPPGGTVLDPFMGSGSTGCAAVLEGFDFIGIEQSAEYAEIAERRIAHWAKRPTVLQPALPLEGAAD